MTAVNLLTPILNGGIQNINFVNGRVLAAEDMTTERTAALQRQRLMGNCVGDGVASGFEVTLSASSVAYGQQVVHISAGVAVNRNGDVLQLPTDTDVALTATVPSVTVNGLFAPCAPPQTQLTNPGVFLLTVLPASGYQGQAPITQLNSAGVAISCSSRYQTSGVQFRLSLVTLASTGSGLQPTLYALANQIQTQLNTGTTAATLAPQLSQLRNGLAHACFGTDTLATYAANPFAGLPGASTFDTYGLIDGQRTAGLVTDCEVPLALAYWSQQGIQFVDMWSARRPVVSTAASEEWPIFSGRRRWTEGLVMFLQFQDQIASLSSSLGASGLSSMAATNYFYYLPSVGLLPLASTQSTTGITYSQFFSNRTYRHASTSVGTSGPFYIEGSKLVPLIFSSLQYPAIDLSNQEMICLYWMRENMEAVSQSTHQPCLIFTNGHVPDQGNAQFDLNYWDYANFV
jgi:hypothetical protein